MPSRFEIKVEDGREEAWRAHVASFDGATVTYDGAKIAAEKAAKSAIFQRMADQILVPFVPERIDKVREGFKNFFTDAFGGERDYNFEFHLDTAEDILRVGTFLHEMFSTMGRNSKPLYLAIAIERYGLVSGEAKSRGDASESVGLSRKTASWPGNRALAEVYSKFRTNKYPGIVKVTPKQTPDF